MRLTPVISLNGTWNMQPEKVGLDRPKGEAWCKVPIPMPWSAFLDPSLGVPDEMVPNRMAWFRRGFIVPEIPPLSRLVVHFDAVNFFAAVYVNGKVCGEHVGDAIPFDVDLTGFVTPGEETVLLVGVQDISAAEARSARSRPAQAARKLVYPGLAHYPGIWGDVFLHIVPSLHIGDISVNTALADRDRIAVQEGRISIRVAVENDTGKPMGFSLTSEVYDGARQVIAFAPVRGVVGPGERTELDMGTSWDSAALWWPDQPHLYTLRTALWSSLPDSHLAGDVVDRVHTRIGFREFRLEGEEFTLNNVPVQLRSEALCPISGQVFGQMRTGAPVRPINPDQAREMLAEVKRSRGLNAVRFHRFPPAPALLDAADEVGLLVVVEFPLPGDEQRYAVDNPKFWVNTQELTRRWVLANAHHPSVVMWSLDRGMVPRYGRRVIDGLQSLARFIADIDPTRPVANDGDGDLVDTAEVFVSSPLSTFFPNTGVAFRTAGPYEPEAVRNRVLPAVDPVPSPWLPARREDRPLCIMDSVRRTLTPGSLAFFAGDAAYGPHVDLSEAAAPLALLEMSACRLAKVVGIHTIGRPLMPAGTSDTAGDLVALPRELFGNFYAGTRFIENLTLRNDTRFDQDCELLTRFTTADGSVTEHSEEHFLAAGSREEKLVAFEVPDIREIQDAGAAASTLAEFSIQMTGSRVGSFQSRRKIGIWPHVRASGARRIGLYDPDGRTASALSAVGARYAAAHGLPHGEFDTLIIGENALEHGAIPDSRTVRSFVADGGLAIVLAQEEIAYDFSPVTLVLDGQRAAAITFVRDGEHPALNGLSSFEMRWWQDDHLVARRCFRKPSAGNFRCLVDAGGAGGLRWAAAVEVFHGKGSYLFSQMTLVERAARAPVAGLLLARLADARPCWQPVEARLGASEDPFRMLGVRCPELPKGFAAPDLGAAQLVLLSGAALRRLSAAQLGTLGEWARRGGTLYLHCVEPGDEKPIAALCGHEVRLIESPQERLVLHRPGWGLARGLSSADLYFCDHGARYLGATTRRVFAATVTVRTGENAAGIASTLDSPTDYALLILPAGAGRIMIDQVRWDVETRRDSRPQRYISTLLTNLGVPLAPVEDVLPSDRCRPVDISAAYNSSLTDPIPGDGSGWTGRGPDNDLSALSPGWLIAAGVPFRVQCAAGDPALNCCVLGPDDEPVTAPVEVGGRIEAFAFLIACEGRVKRGLSIGHFTIHYQDDLETRVALRYGIDVIDWNESARDLEDAHVAWKGLTVLGEPAAIYAKQWKNSRPGVPVKSVVFSSTRAGASPALLAMTALLP